MNTDFSQREKGTPSVSFGEAERVAWLYRRLVLLVGAQFMLGTLVNLPGQQNPSDVAIVIALAALVGMLCVFVGLLVTSYRRMTALGSGSPVLRAIGMCIPLLNIFVLLGISRSAQAWCKRRGITVGFVGPTRASLERLRQP